MNLGSILEAVKRALMTTDARLLSIRWPKRHAAFWTELQPLRAVVDEGVGEGMRAFIACVTLNPALTVDDLRGKRFALTVKTESGGLRLFPMIVDEANPTTSSTPDVAAVNIVGRDALYYMNQRRRMRVFQNLSPLGVIDRVMNETLADPWLAGMFTFRVAVTDKSQYKERACFLQHPDESDLEFVNRVARTNGLEHCWSIQTEAADMPYQPLHTDVPVPELVFFDSPQLLPANPMPVIPFHRRDGVQMSDAIESMVARNRIVPDGVSVNSWDHEVAGLASSSADTDLDQGEDANRLARSLRSTRQAIDHFGDDADELDRLTQVQAKHYAFRAHGLHGRSDVRTMAPGTYQVIENYPQFAGRAVDDCTYMTVRATHVVENNMPVRLHPASQAMAGDTGVPEWATQDGPAADDTSHGTVVHRYINQFHMVPKRAPLVPFYVEERDQPRHRRLIGAVLGSDNGSEIVCDSLGRVRVLLQGAEPDANRTVWVRARGTWGGNNYGHFGALRAGTEVEVELVGPDRLVIAGIHYNAGTPPPSFDQLPGLPENDALSGTVTRELNGTRQQQLRYDDTPGQMSTKLGTDAGNTSVTMGELATPRNSGKAQPRGHGLEANTDHHIAIRAAMRILISAWRLASASVPQLEAEGHEQVARTSLDLAKALGDYAQQHLGLKLDIGPLTALLDAALAKPDLDDPTKAGDPTVNITAPEGVLTTTPKTVAHMAGGNIDNIAHQHLNQTAGQQFNVNAGQGIGLFAHHGGVRATAHNGDLMLQSQAGDTRMESANDVTINARRKLRLMADEIEIISKGAAINLADLLTLMSKGPIVSKGTAFPHSGPDSLALERPNFGSGNVDQRFVLRAAGLDGPIAANAPYDIELTDGTVVSGKSDPEGRTSLLQRDAMRIANIRIQKKGD